MKKLYLLTVLLLCATLATSQSVSFSPSKDVNGIIYSDSIVLRITTDSPLLCGYDKYESTPFGSIARNFDENLETMHKKTMINLQDGVYRYYVKCRPMEDIGNVSAEITIPIIFKISNSIAAKITLDNSPLRAGKHEITLVTTKIPASTPQLKYSYDGIVYNPIVLYGSANSWKGFLIIPSTAGENIGSFKFEARDLESRAGTQIIGDSIFTVDTIPPSTLISIDASGEYGNIKLAWSIDEDEDIVKIKIYKSESPGVDLTDFYEEILGEDTEYYDNEIENGKTYYYKLSPEDSAGNQATLSREIKATSLLGKTATETTLSSELLGSVDALLSEIRLTESEIENSNQMINALTENEKEYIKYFKITDGLKSAGSELSLLKRTVENYKLTDSTKEDLDSKLSSSQIRLNIIKKKIPSNIDLIDSGEVDFKPTEESIRSALLEYSVELSPSQISKTIKNSLKQTKESEIKIKSAVNVFQIIYLDGTSTFQSIVEHNLDSELVKTQGTKFVLKLPSGSLDLNSLSVKNIDYIPEQEGLMSFETDTKKITYTLEQKIDPEILKEITISLITSEDESAPLTGYFLSEIPSSGSLMATFLIFITLSLVGYLFYVKQQQQNELSLGFLGKAKQVKELQKEGKVEESNKLYSELKLEYIGLSKEQKRKVFKEIEHLTKK